MKMELETKGFFQLVKDHTRSWPQQKDNTVDHIWSNTVDIIISYSNERRTLSDHNVIAVRIRLKDRAQPVQEIQKRNRKNLDSTRLVNDLKAANWMDLLKSTNVDVRNGILEEKIRKALDCQAPVKTVQVRKSFRNWVSSELKNKMTARDNSWETARRSGNPQDWEVYRQLRNEITKDTRKVKDKYYNDIFENLGEAEDSRGIYKTAKNLLGWKSTTSPTAFLVEGRLVRKPAEIANIQLEHYEKKN